MVPQEMRKIISVQNKVYFLNNNIPFFLHFADLIVMENNSLPQMLFLTTV